MPGFLGGSSGSGTGGEIRFPAEFIDPVTKFRVSEPQTLIDTDFEYGLQPTKWESVELINNTPSFFSKGGDTTIPNISSITTTELSREIKVTTSLAHGLAVGIPINVSGTKSLTADGAYIINSVPDAFTFTYLCRQNQPESASIEDLYSSIVTGEFFQGSQIKIADSDGLVTNGAGNSVLTVTTESPHGFGINTPFYFLNLNSTISQEFDSSNTNSKAFDASNSSTAQTFDGSNSLVSYAVDLDNAAVLSGAVSAISTVSLVNNTITVSHTSENFVGKPVGTPLYHNVTSASGYFADTPRGVVFLKSLPTSTVNGSIFSVSLLPDGPVLPITSSVTGTFQLANAARTFAGNNIDSSTQTTLTVIKEADIAFDGGNRGYAGAFASNGLSEVLGYTGTTSPFLVSTTAGAGLDYYVNAMLTYSSTGTAATGLTNGRTYFVASFAATATPNQYRITIKELPDSLTVLSPTGGTGTQTFNKIGVAPDKDIVHIPNSNFAEKDMIEYIFPVGGRFTASSVDETKVFYFVSKAYDSHNYQLNENLFSPTAATGGVTATHTAFGITYRTHTFTTTGSNNFVVQSVGTIPSARFMMIAGGGSGAARHGGGGGAGGMIEGVLNLSATTYPISIGAGGTGKFADQKGNIGGNTTFNSLTALGGGGGGSWDDRDGLAGGSGGGASQVLPATGGAATQPGSASGGFGFAGANAQDAGTGHGSGGGGAGGAGVRTATNFRSGPGGAGRTSTIYGRTWFFAGGGGGGSWEAGDPRTGGQGGAGGGGGGGQARSGYAGPGGGMTPNAGGTGVTGIPNSTGGDAGANSGAGGGGGGAYPPNTGYEQTRGGNGGSGIVVIRYPLTPEVPITYTSATGGTITQATETGITYNVHTFTTVGLNTFTITQVGTYPDIEIFAYGAGGGGGQAGGWNYGATGGAGGFAAARHAASLKTYAVMVGGAGANAGGSNNGVSNLNFTSGGGAPSRPDSGDNRYVGQGGGLSGLFDNNTYNAANAILIAGGGGGGGSSRAEQGNMGGAGGGLIGQDGRAAYQGQAYAGKGGTQSGGGANPTAGAGNATLPTQLAGGVTGSYGGGGGGGWWGGSAGSYTEGDTMGGGGGGSSYAHPSKTTDPLFETGHYFYAPSTAFRVNDSVGRGGNIGSNGSNGQVVIRYPIAVSV
jgi:hypothetical protein